jgi:cardiolipin synthase
VAGITDALDGLIARWLNQRTELGAHLDPIADKLLLMAAFVSLAIYKIIPSWLTVIVISRDVLILLGIAVLFITGVKVQIKPSLVSKATTLFQLLTIFLVLLHREFPRITGIIPFFYWLTAILTILSGLHYVYTGLKILQAGSANNRSKR